MVNIDDNFLSLMDDHGDTKDDIKVPDTDLGREIQAKFDKDDQFMVTILVSQSIETTFCVNDNSPCTKQKLNQCDNTALEKL